MNAPVLDHPAAFTLTPDQRTAIFSGDYTAIKLEPGDPKPPIEPGDVVVLAMSKGGKQFLAKTEAERRQRVEEGRPLLTEIPSEPTVWIVLKEPRLKDGRWQIEFEAHDEREFTRTLAAAPRGRSEPGLKTREKKRVAKRGEQRKRKPMSDEAARGYGGGGKSTVDEREGVDFGTLDDFARRVAEENELRRNRNHGRAELLREERLLAEERRRGKSGRIRQKKIDRMKAKLRGA